MSQPAKQIEPEAEAPEAEAPEAKTDRRLPVVPPANVRLNRGGSAFAEWHCRFPENGTLDDLKEPGIWRKIQISPQTAFKQFDELRIIAFDGAWVARCVVAHASQTEVVLSKPTVVQMPARREHLYEDETYAVRYTGDGYTVIRKRDEVAMSPAVHSADAALTVLTRLYPKSG